MTYWPADVTRPTSRNAFVNGDSNNEYAEYLISGLTPGRLYRIEVAVGINTFQVDTNFAARSAIQRTSKKNILLIFFLFQPQGGMFMPLFYFIHSIIFP